MFTKYNISYLNKEQNRYNYLKQQNGKPQLPKTTTLNDRIVRLAKQQGGIIAGSYALKTYNPEYNKKINDIDIIAKSPEKFVQLLVNKLNKLYNKERFKVIKGVNAYRIYDTSNMTFIADVISYPIKKQEYETINGVKLANPEFVFRGKRRKILTSGSMMGLGFKMPNIEKWI